MTNLIIDTPIEIKVPFAEVSDHGLTLVHEMGGKPRNYLHQVSVPGNPPAVTAFLKDAGYERVTGFIQAGVQNWSWTKRFPLTVASW